MAQIRTDLAVESRQAYFEQQGSEPEGVDFSRQTICSCPVSVMTVHTPQAAEKMDKPVGTYFTVDIDALAAVKGIDAASARAVYEKFHAKT